MDIEKRKKFLINIAYFAVILGISVAFMRYVFPALIPFFVALFVSFILKPAVGFVSKKWHIGKNIAAVLLTLLFYATIGILVVLAGISIYNGIENLVSKLPELYRNQIVPALWDLADTLEEQISRFTDSVTVPVEDTFSEIISSLGSAVSNFSVKMISAAGNTAVSVPGFLLNIIIAIVSTAFLSMDWGVIRNFVVGQLSEKNRLLIHNIVLHLGHVLKKYIVSYAIIMTITFVELFIGLQLIGFNGAVLIAAIIAVFDILPIVGSGLVIFPWSVILLFGGDVRRGVGLLILWGVIIIVRYIMEPKVVGDNVGLHPLLTLFAMITGNFLFGGIGILALPVTLALCQELNEEGIIHLYNPAPKSFDTPAKKNKLSNAVSKWFCGLWEFIVRVFRKIFKKGK